MRLLALVPLVSLLGCNVSTSAADPQPDPKRPASSYPKAKPMTGKPHEFPVEKSDDEWKKQLTSAQYYILRKSGTEQPFANKYFNNHEVGDYFCAADHNLLFHSSEKFESGTGWPSFWAPAAADSVKVTTDNSLGVSRDEIVCAKCGGHLGHVFDDGPAPTHLRYCMDSDGMTFEKTKK